MEVEGMGAPQLCRLVMMLRVLGVSNLEQDTDIGHLPSPLYNCTLANVAHPEHFQLQFGSDLF